MMLAAVFFHTAGGLAYQDTRLVQDSGRDQPAASNSEALKVQSDLDTRTSASSCLGHNGVSAGEICLNCLRVQRQVSV